MTTSRTQPADAPRLSARAERGGGTAAWRASTSPPDDDLAQLVTELITLAVHAAQATSDLAEQAFGPARALLDGIAELACASARDVAKRAGTLDEGGNHAAGTSTTSDGLPVLGPGEVTGHDATASFEEALAHAITRIQATLADESVDPDTRAALGAISAELAKRARIVRHPPTSRSTTGDPRWPPT